MSEYQLGQRVSHKKVLELSYEDVKSSTKGLIVITPDFDNFTAKLIAADKYSKYMTEIPILEGVTNREYYGRSATSIENKCKIECKRSIMSTLTNARPLTWPAVLVSPVCEFCLAASVTMEADLPEMTGRFDPNIWVAQ